MIIWNKNMRKIFVGAMILTLFYGCSEAKSSEPTIAKKEYCLDEEFKSNLKIEHPKRQLMVNEIHLSGIVEPNPDNVIHFSNLVDGIIVGTSFSLGDYVKKGQTLAKVKSTELSEWKSRQKSLASQLTVAKQEFDAVQSMYEDGISSKNQLNQAASEVVALESELDKVNSNLELYNASTEKG